MARKTVRSLCVLAAVFLVALLHHDVNEQERRNLFNQNSSSIKSRQLSTTTTYQPLLLSPENDASSNSSGYTYLIIHYHKSGHALTQNLRDILIQVDPSIKRNYIDRFSKREHDSITKCPHLTLHPYTAYVQSSPDFFCDIDILAEELLTRPYKRGVKIIHLIRNPFSMAMSNYNYHSQDPLPEGENWVKRTNPCAVEDKSSVIYANLFMKTLTSPGAYRLMEYDDFHIIQKMCHTLYDQIQSPGFYTHLRTLPPTEGLALATTYLMLGHGGDILRMANNIIKLRQLQTLEQQIHIHQHALPSSKETRIQVLTLSMDNFIRDPKLTTLQFLNFVSFGSNSDTNSGGALLTAQEKEEIATRYEELYYEKVKAGDEHITSLSASKNTNNNTEMMTVLEQSLRTNVVWGRVLGNIENLVEEALRGVHNWY